MANELAASVTEHPARAKTAAERARAYRERKRQRAETVNPEVDHSCNQSAFECPEAPRVALPVPATVPVTGSALAPVTARHGPNVTFPDAAPSRPIAAYVLTAAAFCLGAVGITINGWFARSLGSSELAGWLFLATGAATDCVALSAPSCAAYLWSSRQRATALVGWAVWILTFTFAVTASIGFASVNITDVTLARASRSTPAVTSAEAQLADAMAARDRECKGGVGRFCRDREAEVAERRQILDGALASVGQSADPQTSAAIKLIAWTSRGMVRPTADDFAMLRLTLLALLPQIGGILIMVGRGVGRPR